MLASPREPVGEPLGLHHTFLWVCWAHFSYGSLSGLVCLFHYTPMVFFSSVISCFIYKKQHILTGLYFLQSESDPL